MNAREQLATLVTQLEARDGVTQLSSEGRSMMVACDTFDKDKPLPAWAAQAVDACIADMTACLNVEVQT
jgi:hypothetical protein